MRRRLTIAASAFLAAAAGAVATVALPGVAAASAGADVQVPGYDFRVLGTQYLSKYTYVDGGRVSDLSGIDFDPATGGWYLVSDRSSRWQPARFHTAELSLSENGFDGVRVTSATTFERQDGSAFPAGGPAAVVPEAVRVDPADGSLLWASEGNRDVPRRGAPVLADPAVRRSATDGAFVSAHPTAPYHAASADEQGIRDGLGLNGLTLNASGTLAVSATEGPLLQDGPVPSHAAGAPVRVNFARTSGAVLTQLVYELDPVPSGGRGNGLVEILARDASRYLVLERAPMADGSFSVRLFEANASGARTVLPSTSLDGVDYTPMTKRLLLDLSDLGRAGNIEGMAWGPTLPSGERTLVLVSDNDCAGSTQLIALAVALS